MSKLLLPLPDRSRRYTAVRAMVEAWEGMGVGVWVSSALEARRGLLFKLTTTSLETTVGMKDRG